MDILSFHFRAKKVQGVQKFKEFKSGRLAVIKLQRQDAHKLRNSHFLSSDDVGAAWQFGERLEVAAQELSADGIYVALELGSALHIYYLGRCAVGADDECLCRTRCWRDIYYTERTHFEVITICIPELVVGNVVGVDAAECIVALIVACGCPSALSNRCGLSDFRNCSFFEVRKDHRNRSGISRRRGKLSARTSCRSDRRADQ